MDPSRRTGCLDEGELVAYLAGALTGRSLEAVQAHFDACPSCRRLAGEAARADVTPQPRAHDRTGRAGPVDRTFEPGGRIAERYVVRRFVAAGGMGEVYEVADELLGAVVALKTLTWMAQGSRSAFARLRSEVQLARRVSHPNVCRILDFGVHDPAAAAGAIPFFTMELLDGETLGRRLAERGPLASDEAWAFARQLASGLAAIHGCGIVHRDLKSDNVFLLPTRGPDGEPFRVVVMDFGLARPTAPEAPRSFSQAGAVVGTLAYMAPEQLAGLGATVRSDLYSVGVVLYEALTGRLPFQERPRGREAVTSTAEPRPKGTLLGDPLPAAWAPIVRRCLEIEPGARFDGATALRAALEAARDAPAPRRRHRALALGAAGLAAVGLGAAALSSGRRAAAPSASVDPRPQGPWGPPEIVETVETGFSNLPHVAANRSGAAAVVWEQIDRTTGGNDLWGRHLDPARGWGEATRLERGAGKVRSGQAAIDGRGRAVAVWLQTEGERQHAYAARFEPATGWSPEERLDEPGSEGVERVRVAAGEGEGAVVVWHEKAGTRGRLRARRLMPQGAWSAPEEVSDVGGSARWPDVAVDGQGRAVAAWVRSRPAGHALTVRRFVPGAGWEPPIALEPEGQESTVPLVAADATGRTVVVWRRPEGATVDVWASPFVPGRGWAWPRRLERRDDEAGFARIGVGGGAAIALWKQAEPPRRPGEAAGEMRLWASRFSFDHGWEAPLELPTPPAGRIEKPEIAMDAEGHALVTWAQEKGGRDTDVWAEEYDPGTGWARPRLVEASPALAGSPAAALTRGGHGIVVWPQVQGGEFKILGVRF